MTFRSKFVTKKLLVGSLAALALSLSLGASSVSATANRPFVASQCTTPGYAHFGFATKQACLDYVASHAGQGQGSGYGGNGGHNQSSPNIFVSVSNIVNSAVSITINVVTNFFS